MTDEYEEAFNEFANKEADDKSAEVAEEDVTDESEEEVIEEEVAEGSTEEGNTLNLQLEELRKQNQELEHYRKSNEGRVSALQKKVDELSTKPDEPEGDEKWNQFKEEDEFIATHLENKIINTEKQIKDDLLQEMDKRLRPIQEREQEMYIDSQINKLKQDEPDWENIVHSQEFDGWLQSQPSKIQEMAASNEADDYLYLIRGYQSTQSSKKSAEAQLIKDERQQKLANNVTIPRRNVTQTAAAPQDFEGAFDYYAKKIAQEKARGY